MTNNKIHCINKLIYKIERMCITPLAFRRQIKSRTYQCEDTVPYSQQTLFYMSVKRPYYPHSSTENVQKIFFFCSSYLNIGIQLFSMLSLIFFLEKSAAPAASTPSSGGFSFGLAGAQPPASGGFSFGQGIFLFREWAKQTWVYCTIPQIFMKTYSYSLDLQLWEIYRILICWFIKLSVKIFQQKG